MPQRLLGLDIGSYSVKGALYDVTFRTHELTDLFESTPLRLEEVDDQDRSVIITEAITRLIEEHHIQAAGVVTALPGTSVSTRILSLPLQERQVEKVLPFELESVLPFALNDIVVDHHAILPEKTRTVCLAAAIQKSSIAEHLALLRSAELEPAFVGLDSLFLYNLNQLENVDDEKATAFVDVGHEKTSICIIAEGKPRYVRTLFSAGSVFTEVLREKLDLTWEQAVEVKHTHSILELPDQPLRSSDLQKVSTALRTCVDPLIKDILQTFHAYRGQYTNFSMNAPQVEKIILSGGGSLIRNFAEHLSHLTKLPVQRVHIFPEGHEASVKLGKREPVFAQAVALGLRAASRGPNANRIASLNFRKGEFAFARDLSDIKNKAFFFGSWVLAIFIAALLHVGFSYHNLSQEHAQVDQKAIKAFKEIVPDFKPAPRKASEALRLLNAKIAEFRRKQEILTSGLKDTTALGILREISKQIPDSVALDTQELSIERNKVTLRAHADSFAAVDTIISALKKYPSFQSITKGDIREAPGGKKSFQLVITIGDEDNEQPRRRR